MTLQEKLIDLLTHVKAIDRSRHIDRRNKMVRRLVVRYLEPILASAQAEEFVATLILMRAENRVKLVPEEHRAWNAEVGGRNTAS